MLKENDAVIHNIYYGNGVIRKITDEKVYVEFKRGIRIFPYPAAFEKGYLQSISEEGFPKDDSEAYETELVQTETYSEEIEESEEMRTVNSLPEIFQNCRILDEYLSSADDLNKEFAINLIKRGTCFLAVKRNGSYRFYPSRFVGYANNNRNKHEVNDQKDGKVTNPAISAILKIKKPVANEKLNNEYIKFCDNLGFEARAKGAFGVARKFWEVQV